ncbi:TerD family protein [Kitasatospora sp. NPDC051853]|uniref:TerD family protein n=1 Tax=Kitasatospora sp. NPDC051853 TaxID=3364058 RepID=UPI0037991FAD
MTKGANIGLDTLTTELDPFVVSVGWSSPTGEGDADVSVLLVTADGKVRSNADFLFYNNPAAADGSVQLLGQRLTESGAEDRIGIDLSALPAEVERVVIAASRHQLAPFSQLEALRVGLADSFGEQLLGFAIEPSGAENALVFGELYRLAGHWKFRAVGQGYDTGLAGLATAFGVEVDDEPPSPVVAAPSVASATPVAGPVRTTRKKVTLPKEAKDSFAENAQWHPARLFPAPTLKNDHEREVRATSVLLAVMAQVPEFGRRLTAPFGAPAGRMETFTEVKLPHGKGTRYPDGVIVVERAGGPWRALVESKTNGNPLKSAQIQDYLDIAAHREDDAVITVSNDVAVDGLPLVKVRTDSAGRHRVGLWHLSWAEIAHQAKMLIRHEGLGHPAHAWLLQELLHYLRHDHSGCHGFQRMGPAWVPVRNAVELSKLQRGDERALQVVESWERLTQQICLELGGELGVRVRPVIKRTDRAEGALGRLTAAADRLADEGRLHAEIRIDDAPGNLLLTADLRAKKLCTSIEVPAPEQGRPSDWAERLVGQLADAPAGLHVEALVDGTPQGPSRTLSALRLVPGELLPRHDSRPTGFRLSLYKGLPDKGGQAGATFIRSVDTAVGRFHSTVVAALT